MREFIAKFYIKQTILLNLLVQEGFLFMQQCTRVLYKIRIVQKGFFANYSKLSNHEK